MKNLFATTILAAALLSVSALNSHADVTTNVSPSMNAAVPYNPFAGIVDATIDTNDNLFATSNVRFRAGTVNLSGPTLGGSYHATKWLSIEGKFANVNGNVNEAAGGPGIYYDYHNIELTGYTIAGYNWEGRCVFIQPGARASYHPSLANRICAYVDISAKVLFGGSTDPHQIPKAPLEIGVEYPF